MLKFIIRSASNNSPFKNDWGQGYGTFHSDRKVILNHTVYRENLIMSLSIMKASFRVKDPYLVLKSRGQLAVEMVPLIVSQYDQSKKNINPKDRYVGYLKNEAIYSLLHEKFMKNTYRKENDVYDITASYDSDGWEWTIIKNSSEETKRTVFLNKIEKFYALEFIKYSIPYIQGWYAIGDSRIAEQNMVSDGEIKDPFENI
jgi:hypothetical protein